MDRAREVNKEAEPDKREKRSYKMLLWIQEKRGAGSRSTGCVPAAHTWNSWNPHSSRQGHCHGAGHAPTTHLAVCAITHQMHWLSQTNPKYVAKEGKKWRVGEVGGFSNHTAEGSLSPLEVASFDYTASLHRWVWAWSWFGRRRWELYIGEWALILVGTEVLGQGGGSLALIHLLSAKEMIGRSCIRCWCPTGRTQLCLERCCSPVLPHIAVIISYWTLETCWIL